MTSARPFYGSFAWAYDALVERPVAAECVFIAAALVARDVAAGARVLDAGCGTGRYSAALAGHGYRVAGVDGSPELLAVARGRGGCVVAADLAVLPLARAFDAVLCRGVLNDVLDADARDVVLRALAGVLRPGGVLVLDVRDWDASVREKTQQPVHERTVQTERGILTFRSETRLEAARRRLLISERHVLDAAGDSRTETFEFVMGCWTGEELRARLAAAGFDHVDIFAGYATNPPRETSDRIVAVARRRAE